MPRLAERINLSDELKRIPISELIVIAKSLIGGKKYSQSTIWHYNERFNDLQRSSVLASTAKLSEEFIAQYIEEGAQKSPWLTCSRVQRKSLLNLIATAADTTPIFTISKDSDGIQNKFLRESLSTYEQHLRKQDKSKETVASYLQTATKFLLYLEKNEKTNLSKVMATDIREFITELGFKILRRHIRCFGLE
jgi:site-specific recombinase XerD